MRFSKLLAVTIILVICILALASLAFSRSRFNVIPHTISALTSSTYRTKFPQVDSSKLSPSQQKIVSTLKQEYDSQPTGVKYSEGISEPWCADFVSWVFKAADEPLINPNSGSWRIPGTYTLRQYYESISKFKSANSGYSPTVGDIMLYDNPSPFGQHANIVVKNDKGIITTVGGNEPGGIRVVIHTIPDKAGFIGYGLLYK